METVFDIWLDTALKASDMMNTSTQVFAQRTSRIALSAWFPALLDPQEIDLMGCEKPEAAFESLQAIGQSMSSSYQKMGLRAAEHALTATSDLMVLSSTFTPWLAKNRQEKLVNDSVNNAISNGSMFSISFALAAAEGLKPIHERVTTNAQRLAANETPHS